MTYHFDLNLVVILVITALNAYQAWLSWKTKQDIRVIEKATNSMKDALVQATAAASLAEGHATGLAQGRAENSNGNTPLTD